MSNYTTEVRFICETNSNLDSSVGYSNIEQVLAQSWEKIFNFDFPIFDEAYRKVLCIKILRHFYTREIGFETVGLWKLKLNTKLNEIMPYYNQLYKSELLEFNPLYDVEYTKKVDGTKTDDYTENKTLNDTNTNTKNGSTTTHSQLGGQSKTVVDGENTNLYADTPTQSLGTIFPDGSSPNYLTNARKVNDKTTTTTTPTTTQDGTETYNDITVKDVRTGTDIKKNSGSTIDDYLEKVSGKTGGITYSKMLKEYRQTFLNIDMLVIDELKDLFFNLW